MLLQVLDQTMLAYETGRETAIPPTSECHLTVARNVNQHVTDVLQIRDHSPIPDFRPHATRYVSLGQP